MNKHFGRMLAVTLALVMVTLASCGKKSGNADVSDANRFTYWITAADDYGTYYNKYEDNMSVQWLNNQYWDLKNHTLGAEGSGEKIAMSFSLAVAGSQKDSFNTMLATQTYPEVVDLNYADDSPKKLYEEGVLVEITEYVEKYLSNYMAFLDNNPDLKKFVCDTDSSGKDHYYALYNISDSTVISWCGYGYRRDWVVKYAIPTEYVWDWDSDFVKANGHAKVTPLSEAIAQNDMTGWKKNDVTAFTKSEGSDPNNDYTDNVIFPSGKNDPYTVSDWEWMFEAFSKALKERGFESNTNAYCTTLTYPGYFQPGDLVSSFGGANGGWYLKDGKVEFSGTTDNFKTYVECMNNWYKNGWLDTKFETRSSDMFYDINPTGFNQGMVGMSNIMNPSLGAQIRPTCVSEEDKRDAMVFGCSLPVNDIYGADAQKFKAPDSLYQSARTLNPLGFTNKCEGKNMEALFSMINWMYSRDGGLIAFAGINEEQYKSMKFEPDMFEKFGITTSYTIETGADGEKVCHITIPVTDLACNTLRPLRTGSQWQTSVIKMGDLIMDSGYSKVIGDSIEAWMAYISTGSMLNYVDFLTEKESQLYVKTNNYIIDYMSQAVPQMIKGGLGDWDNYVKKITKFAPDKVSEAFQAYVD